MGERGREKEGKKRGGRKREADNFHPLVHSCKTAAVTAGSGPD